MVISLENLSVHSESFNGGRFQGRPVINNITFNVENGELVYIIGKVGSGKSTLLKTLYGELQPSRGKAVVAGYNLNRIGRKEIPFLRRRLGVVFQDFQLLPDRNIYENMCYVLAATSDLSKDQIHRRVYEILSLVKLEKKATKMPYELSGGEQQRAAIGRAFLNNPELIIADEPTANLDPETGEEIISLFADITQMGCSVIIATHDISLIEYCPSRTFRFSAGTLEEIDIYEIFGISMPPQEDSFSATITTQYESNSYEQYSAEEYNDNFDENNL